MNKDTVKGSVDDAAGRAKRQVGEWTGDTKAQADGVAQQVKGKVEKAVGNVKDALKDARTDADRERQRKIENERAGNVESTRFNSTRGNS
ncbi:MAG: CsbD family protein [Terracidiphilus sp.]